MRTLAEELKWDETKALDFRDIRRILTGRGGKAHGLKAGYVDLESVKGALTLDRFLPSGHNVCCVLLTAHLGGAPQRHWCALIRNKHGVHFFDSLNMGKPLMTRILEDKGKFVRFLQSVKAKWSNKRLQENKNKIRTCGLHTAVRCYCWQMTNPEYERWLISATACFSPDKLVSLLTLMGHV